MKANNYLTLKNARSRTDCLKIKVSYHLQSQSLPKVGEKTEWRHQGSLPRLHLSLESFPVKASDLCLRPRLHWPSEFPPGAPASAQSAWVQGGGESSCIEG